MHFHKTFIMCMVVVVVTLAACQLMIMPSVEQATLMEQEQKTTEVTTAALRQILADRSVFVFDARPHLEYSISHIPGALNVAPKPK